nr:C2H2-type zinc finger protein [Candidatus Freyarchaeota archaeon]
MSIKCPQCGKMFRTPDELRKHTSEAHPMGAKPAVGPKPAVAPAKPAAAPAKPAAKPKGKKK